MAADAQKPSPKLDLKDLLAAAEVIDLAASRGAIRGDEMATVGALRDRLVAFVSANSPKTPAPSEKAAEPAPQKN